MLQLTPQSKIFVSINHTDFRKGIDGLAAIVKNNFAPDFGIKGKILRSSIQ